MPEIMHTSPEILELFQEKAKARGLDLEHAPAAVQITMQSLLTAMRPFHDLLSDLPSESRAFEWMSIGFQSFAHWCDHTIVVNNPTTNESPQSPEQGGEGGQK